MIPIIIVEGETISEAWEKSIIELWNKGIISMKESFYGKSFEYIKEATTMLIVRNPSKEPRVHPWYQADRSFFDRYTKEVIEGYVVNVKVRKLQKESLDFTDILTRRETFSFKPTYTYYERHRKYRGKIDQIGYIIKYLRKTPHTNRAISVTWIPEIDQKNVDVPCNIVIWCKIIEDKLVMETYWRSRDAWRGALPNMYALTELQKMIADECKVEPGYYIDFTSSYHIYEESFYEVKEALATKDK